MPKINLYVVSYSKRTAAVAAILTYTDDFGRSACKLYTQYLGERAKPQADLLALHCALAAVGQSHFTEPCEVFFNSEYAIKCCTAAKTQDGKVRPNLELIEPLQSTYGKFHRIGLVKVGSTDPTMMFLQEMARNCASSKHSEFKAAKLDAVMRSITASAKPAKAVRATSEKA